MVENDTRIGCIIRYPRPLCKRFSVVAFIFYDGRVAV